MEKRTVVLVVALLMALSTLGYVFQPSSVIEYNGPCVGKITGFESGYVVYRDGSFVKTDTYEENDLFVYRLGRVEAEVSGTTLELGALITLERNVGDTVRGDCFVSKEERLFIERVV